MRDFGRRMIEEQTIYHSNGTLNEDLFISLAMHSSIGVPPTCIKVRTRSSTVKKRNK